MKPNRFACAIAWIVPAAAVAGAAAPVVDLRGTVVSAGGGAPVAGARAVLLAAGASDTTDASGAFHIVADELAIARPAAGTRGGTIAGRGIEAFDAAGRRVAEPDGARHPAEGAIAGGNGAGNPTVKAIRIGSLDGTPLYGARRGATSKEGGGAWARKDPLAKSAAPIDTLIVSAEGFRTSRTPVADYLSDLGTITLQAGIDGFDIRKPSERELVCGSSNTSTFDLDVVCELENDSLRAAVYVRSRPVSCGAMTAINYEVERAWIRTDAGIEELDEAYYDGGGNHHNDRVTFAWKGRYYSIYHSSFGFGFRSCAPPDCMQICRDLKCTALAYDGCRRDACAAPPALKARCSTVLPDGNVPNPVDPWEDGGGNPQSPNLPCAGDALCR